MKIGLIGGTGFVGSAILAELLQRDHAVTALARHPTRFMPRERLTVVRADAMKEAQVAASLVDHDAVISAFNPGWSEVRLYELFMRGSRAIFAGVRQAGVKRFLMVGGAGSLYAAPGVHVLDLPDFPSEWKSSARATRDALELLRGETTLAWTYVSPPVLLQPGARKGRYRVGGDAPLMDGDRPGRISVADLAVAIVDEIEMPRHVRQRFTVAY